MSIVFSPTGPLNINDDASELPQAADGNNISSGAVVRCKNLTLDKLGLAKLRDGSAKINASAIDTDIDLIFMQGGTRYSFSGDKIYNDETSIATGLTAAAWSAIGYNQYNDTTDQVYALNGTDRKRITGSTVYEWGQDAPATPTLSGKTSGSLSGVYTWKYTYAIYVGSTLVYESNPSSASASDTYASEQITITFTPSSDAAITHYNLYRTAASGSTYYYVESVAIASSTTTDSGSVADGSLTVAAPSNHNRPPLGTVVLGPSFNGTCFILKDNLLYFSLAQQPEYWPLTYYIEVSDPRFPLKAGVFYNGQLHVLSKNEIYYIQGTGATTFFPIPMKAKTGTVNQHSAVSIRGKGIFHLASDGIYLFSGTDMKWSKRYIDPIFRGESVNGIPAISSITDAWLFNRGDKLYFGYTSSGNSNPTNVIVFDLEVEGRIYYYNYNDLGLNAIAYDDTNERILIAGDDGFIYQIEKTSATDDAGTAISWEIQSKDYTLPTRAHFPRWVKYDIDASSSTTCTGELLLDGTSKQSHTITGNRSTKRRLVDTCNGQKASLKVSGSGPVSIYTIESE